MAGEEFVRAGARADENERQTLESRICREEY